MQYLVTMEYVDPGPLLSPQDFVGMERTAVLPGLQALARLQSEGKVLGGELLVGERAAAFVVEADSNKELDELLVDLPLWGIVRTKVTPLHRFEDRLEQDRQFLERLEESLNSEGRHPYCSSA